MQDLTRPAPGEPVDSEDQGLLDTPGAGWVRDHIGEELESYSLAIPLRDDIGAHLFPGLPTTTPQAREPKNTG